MYHINKSLSLIHILKVVPSSVVYHLGGGSLPMNHPRKLFLNYRNNLLMLHKNLCAKQRKKIFFARVLLDTMAGGLFLLKGQWSNTRSVIRAYKAFREMRKVYPVPERSVSLSGIYPVSYTHLEEVEEGDQYRHL